MVSEEIPLDDYTISSNETSITLNNLQQDMNNENVISIAPGESKKPLSLLAYEYCEKLSHPHLFRTGKFGYNINREISLSPVKYFNQRLLNHTKKFASDSDYTFYAHSVQQQLILTAK